MSKYWVEFSSMRESARPGQAALSSWLAQVVCPSANATIHHHLLGTWAKQFSVNSVSTSINKYQISIKLAVSSNWQKSPCQVTLHEKSWLFSVCGADFRSEFTTNSLRQKKLLDLSQYMFLFTNPQPLICTVSWNWWKSSQTKDLSLDKQSFLIIAHMKQQSFCSECLWNGKGRPEKLKPLLSLSTSCYLLRWQSQGLASSGQNVSLNRNSWQIWSW